MEENRLTFVEYHFSKKLSHIDKCKIAVHFSNDYKVDEMFLLQHKSNDMRIQIEKYRIIFFDMNAKEALKKYEEIAIILSIKDAGGAE